MIHGFHDLLRPALLASISALAIVSTAQAQETTTAPVGQNPPPSDTSSDATVPGQPGGGLEDIIVTARKRSESLQDIPVAVVAYTPAQIARYDLTSIESIAALTPNLTVGRATGGTGAQITLRGIGSPASALGIESSTAIIVDGAYYGNGRILNEGFFDLSGIQVLKGPQALFFGKNATAGVLAIDTANPTDSFLASTKVGYEFKAEQVYLEQVISTPLTDTMGLRVAIRATNMFGGYSRNYATAQPFTVTDVNNPTGPVQSFVAPAAAQYSPRERELVGRVTLKWEPIDGLTNVFKASGSFSHTNDNAWNNIIYSCPGGFSALQPTVRCQRDWKFYHNQMAPEVAANFPHAGDRGELYTDYRAYSLTNNLEYQIGSVTLTSNTNYQHQRFEWFTDSDYQQRAVQVNVGSGELWHAFSEELRASTTYDFPINVVIGALYQRTKLVADTAILSGNVRSSTAPKPFEYLAYYRTSYTDGETISPFAQVIWKVIPELELSGGLRYTHETKDSFFVQPYARTGTIYRANAPVYGDQTFTAYTPEVTVAYRPTRALTIYGGYKTGYKSGGFANNSNYTTASSPNDLLFRPEKAKGFEGGVKLTGLDNQLRVDLTGYTYRYTDLQVDFFDAQIIRSITTNAGAARTKGVELSLDFAPRAVPDLTLRGSLNYNDARYINFIAPCVVGQTPALGCLPTTTSPYGGVFVQNLRGQPTANAPHWTGSAGGIFERPVGGDLRVGLSVDARYSSGYNASAFHNPLATQPKYVNLDASLSLRSAEHWEASLIGKNLTNQFVVSGSIDATGTGSGTGTAAGVLANQRGFANNPRTVQLQFVYRY